MSVLAAALRHMLAAGMDQEAILAAVSEMERMLRAEAANDIGPSKGALRQRRYEERKRQKASESVRNDAGPSEDDASPSLDKEKSPTPPKEIKPTPGVVTALARKAGGFGPPDGVPLDRWNALCQQRKKPVTEIAYNRMCKTLREGVEAGWPPGELVERSIERGYETVFVPKEQRHERPNPIRRTGTDTSGADIFAELQARRQAHPH